MNPTTDMPLEVLYGVGGHLTHQLQECRIIH